MTPDSIIHFWEEAGEKRWFTKDAAFDDMVSTLFSGVLAEAKTGAHDGWANTAEGALALVILLDQFSRNIHRDSRLAFAADGQALTIAKSAIARGYHTVMPAQRAMWFVMPFEHAEDLDCQHQAVTLFREMGLPEMVHWAEVHRDIIRLFSRFPHRNRILGRPSTPEELAFLEAGGFAG